MNVIKFHFYRILSVTIGTVLIIDSALSAQYTLLLLGKYDHLYFFLNPPAYIWCV